MPCTWLCPCTSAHVLDLLVSIAHRVLRLFSAQAALKSIPFRSSTRFLALLTSIGTPTSANSFHLGVAMSCQRRREHAVICTAMLYARPCMRRMMLYACIKSCYTHSYYVHAIASLGCSQGYVMAVPLINMTRLAGPTEFDLGSHLFAFRKEELARLEQQSRPNAEAGNRPPTQLPQLSLPAYPLRGSHQTPSHLPSTPLPLSRLSFSLTPT